MAQTTDYILDNTWGKARRRLGLIEQLYDAATMESLRATGIAPGWRCLEVGAGAGSIARWMCDVVGPAGSVTAVDLEPTLLREQPRPNLEIVQADVTAAPLPGEAYDLVHARGLLVHLPDRESVITSMLRCLRPGGVIVLEEPDFGPMDMSENASFVEFCRGMASSAAARGGDWYWARRLPAALAAVAVDVSASCRVGMFRGGALQAELMRLTVEQMAPLLEADGIDRERIEEVYAALENPTAWFSGFAEVTASGRRSG